MFHLFILFMILARLVLHSYQNLSLEDEFYLFFNHTETFLKGWKFCFKAHYYNQYKYR